MKLEDVKKRKRFAACASDEDVLKEIDALEAEAVKVPTLQDENKTLKDENDAYKQGEQARETAEKKALLDAAQADGRIDATTRKTYENLLNADRENGEDALKALTPKRKVMEDLHTVDHGLDTGADSPWNKRMNQISENLKR